MSTESIDSDATSDQGGLRQSQSKTQVDVDQLKAKANELFAEGNILQSLEYFSTILEVEPRDPEAIQGRLSACIKLKLFHRCLADLATLTELRPHEAKVYKTSGFLFEQVSAYEKSLISYLKAYSLDKKNRAELGKKVSDLCSRLIECSENDTEDKCVDNLENFVLLSKKLYEKGKFEACYEILKMILTIFCMNENNGIRFDQELSSRFDQDKEALSPSEQCCDVVRPSETSRNQEQPCFEVDRTIVNQVLLDTSECCFQLGRMYSAIWLAEMTLENSLISGNTVSEVTACSKLAFLHSKLKDHSDLSISYYTRTLAKCREKLLCERELDMESKLKISFLQRENLLALCVLFKELSRYEDAHVFAKEYFSKVEMVEQESLVEAYGILGDVERHLGLYEDAMKSHRMELVLCQRFHDQLGKALAYTHLGKVHEAHGHTVLAAECYELHLKIARSQNDLSSQALAYGHLGDVFTAHNDHGRALTCYEKQLDLATDSKLRHLRCQALTSLGCSYKYQQLFQHAETFFKNALRESQELNVSEEYKMKQSLAEVFLVLEKRNDALPLLLEVLDHIEAEFHRIRNSRIVTHHPLLDEFERCLDDVLVLLAEGGRIEFALELVERSNAMVFHQMLEYRAFVEASDEVDCGPLTSPNLLEIVKTRQKLTLVYRPVKNGYMVWVLTPSQQGVARFYWHKETSKTPFTELLETNINGLLKPRQPVALFSCDHRKLGEPDTCPINGSSSSYTDNRTDFFSRLSKLFVAPIEDIFDENLSNLDLVVVKSSFLNLVPFSDLHTSSGKPLHGFFNATQSLPCVAALTVLNTRACDAARPIRILGSPDMDEIPGDPPWTSSNSQLELLDQELSDVSVLLDVPTIVGKSASKEHFLRIFSSTSLLHLATYGCHDEGVIALAPVPGQDPRTIARDAWTVTLEDIVTLRQGPDVVVFTSCYGMHHRFSELHSFTLNIPLAFMIAGVKTVVMPTWSVPQKVLLGNLREFYNNLSTGASVDRSLVKAKQYIQTLQAFSEPFFWASFQLYGGDTCVPVRAVQRHSADLSFNDAQLGILGRFESDDPIKGRRLRVSECLVEQLAHLLHHHHVHPDLLTFLQELMHEAREILQPGSKLTQRLPYREINAPWLTQVLEVKNLLLSVGFVVKKTISEKTILVYPHWNENGCLEKMHLLLKSLTKVLSHSPILANALRVVLSQEKKLLVNQFAAMLKEISENLSENIPLANDNSIRMFWTKPSTRRLMSALHFRQVGLVLDFRNTKEDRRVVEACWNILNVMMQFDVDCEPDPFPHKVNLSAPWMSHRAGKDENKARLVLSQRLDDIESKYKNKKEEVKKWHNDVLVGQAQTLQSKEANTSGPEGMPKFEQTASERSSTLPGLAKNTHAGKETLDLTKFRGHVTKVKVQSGSSPSCTRVPVTAVHQVPLAECVMKRDESYKTLYRSLNEMETRKREEITKLVTL